MESSNTRLLKTVARLAQPPLVIRLYERLGEIPPFNPDLDVAPFPDAVMSLRANVSAADAVIFSTPEYAHGMPGVLKNALDWLVGSGEFYGKPVTLFHASSRGTFAQAGLREVLRTMGARYLAVAEITMVGNAPVGEAEARLQVEAALRALIG